MFGLSKDYVRKIFGYRKVSVVRLLQGLSCEEKYYIQTKDGKEFLLKLYDSSCFSRISDEQLWIRYLTSNNVPTNCVLDFGVSNNTKCAYMLLSWLPGVALFDAIQNADSDICAQLGAKAGRLLRQIHQIPLPGQAILLWLADMLCRKQA